MAEIYLNHMFPCGSAIERMQVALEDKDFLLVDRYLQMIADLLGASPKDSFSFTSSGAEAIASVHWTAFIEIARKTGKTHFITSAGEDAALLQSLKRLEELGCFVKIAPLDTTGRIDLDKLAELISPRTAMISISTAHGLTGVLQPIEEIAALAKEKEVLLHGDVTYGLGKVLNPFEHLDYLTFAGDWIHSVRGSGGVLTREGHPFIPIVPGKTELDAPSLIALGAAATQAALTLDTMSLEVARLRDRLEEKILTATPLFQDTLRLPNVSVLTFPHIHQEMLHYTLQRKKVLTSIGGLRSPHLHRHLMACGIDEQMARTAISFSLSRFTTQNEIDQAIQIINETINALKPLAEDLF